MEDFDKRNSFQLTKCALDRRSFSSEVFHNKVGNLISSGTLVLILEIIINLIVTKRGNFLEEV